MDAIVVEVMKLKLEAGDVLCLKIPNPATEEQYQHMQNGLKEILPNGVRIMFLEGNMELSVIKGEEYKEDLKQLILNTVINSIKEKSILKRTIQDHIAVSLFSTMNLKKEIDIP